MANLVWLILGLSVTASIWVAPTSEIESADSNRGHSEAAALGAPVVDFSRLDACRQLTEEDQEALGIDGGVESGPGASSCQFEGAGRMSTTTVALLNGPLYARRQSEMSRSGRVVSGPLGGLPASGVQIYDQGGRDTCMVLVNYPGGNGALIVDWNLGDPSMSMFDLCRHVARVATTVIRSIH